MAMIYKIVLMVLFASVMLLPMALSASGSSHARYHYYGNGFAESGSAEAMVADALVARPIGLVTTVVGSAVYVVSLPFSLLGGNEKQAREKLVKEPSAFTFTRPLGEFESLD